eukprot:scaffold290_cov367-Pinguiococcus_pyrenoidosus.AAC.1
MSAFCSPTLLEPFTKALVSIKAGSLAPPAATASSSVTFARIASESVATNTFTFALAAAKYFGITDLAQSR